MKVPSSGTRTGRPAQDPMGITALLNSANAGDAEALNLLAPLVYSELRWLAHNAMRKESGSQTLSTTALVHEAYLKMSDGNELPAESRRHFYGAAARAMRQILVDAARRRNSAKHGGDLARATLDPQHLAIDAVSTNLIALDQALENLARHDARLAQVVECRFFGGLAVEETASVLDISARSVKRDWRTARAWLYRELSQVAVVLDEA